MPAFHQIGHDSENLLFEDGLGRFGGAILSPLNYGPADVAEQIRRLSLRNDFVTILDPHLYRPTSDRLCLPQWDYYPKDVDTADLNDQKWWASIIDKVAKTSIELRPTAVASPAIVPKTFPNEFYLQVVEHGNLLEAALRGCSVKPVQTVILNIADLASPARAMTIASIISRSRISDCLLVLVGSLEPRREIADPEELKGVMLLINTLESGGQNVTVGSCSSEMILWKAAGATNCATGKFFNLRRFTIARFDEPTGGGGQLSYWFEEALLAFLRQSDLLRVQARELSSSASTDNAFSAQILKAIPQGQPWVALGWRQFLFWFADAEFRLRTGAVSAEDLVTIADTNWATIEKSKPPLIMEERQNDGSWVRQWLRALVEFPYFR
jgi:hypothetical protein